MSTTFMTSPQYFFTSESVSEGHPDKMCDQISDAILDAILEQDPNARVACETSTTTGLVLVFGEITTSAYVDIEQIVRDTVTEIGYVRGKYGFDAETCGVLVSIKEQSGDIAQGVDQALEAREGQMSEAEIEATGAGDQGMMIGFACDETPELMPLTVSLSHQLVRRMAELRKSGALRWLRPGRKKPGYCRICAGQAQTCRHRCCLHSARARNQPGRYPQYDHKRRYQIGHPG